MLTRQEVTDIAEAAADNAVRKMMLSLGADPATPLELQKDFALLRNWRTSTETVKQQSLRTAVIVLLTAGLAWLGLRLFGSA